MPRICSGICKFQILRPFWAWLTFTFGFPETRLGVCDIFQVDHRLLIDFLIMISDHAPYLTWWYGRASSRLIVNLLLIRDPLEVLDSTDS
jgi:hypothetical protein